MSKTEKYAVKLKQRPDQLRCVGLRNDTIALRGSVRQHDSNCQLHANKQMWIHRERPRRFLCERRESDAHKPAPRLPEERTAAECGRKRGEMVKRAGRNCRSGQSRASSERRRPLQRPGEKLPKPLKRGQRRRFQRPDTAELQVGGNKIANADLHRG